MKQGCGAFPGGKLVVFIREGLIPVKQLNGIFGDKRPL